MENYRFLNGPFYINENYGLSLVPSLLSLLMHGPQNNNPPDKAQLLQNVQQNVPADATKAIQQKVVVLDFKQPVVKYSDWYYLGTQDYIKKLNQLKTDSTCGAVVLDVDSGGGQAYGTPEFYDVIKDFTATKPLVIYTNGYLCSGAYYFAAPASFIIANPRAEDIGSIGAFTTLIDFKGIYERFGAKVHTIYSDLSPEKNKAYRDVENGSDADYSQFIKKELNPLVQNFQNDMLAARPQLNPEVLKGGTWNGTRAVEMGLVDATGTLQDAIDKAFSLIQNTNQNSNENMAKLDLPEIEKTLGLENSLETQNIAVSTKAGCFLEASQLEAINNILVQNANTIADLQTQVTNLTTANQKTETALATALAAAEIEATTNVAEGITLLSNKVTEYGAKAGATIQKPISEGDNFDDADKPSYSIFKSITE